MKTRPKVSVYIAISIDGYIARIDGGLDWLEKFNSLEGNSEDYGYQKFLSTIDTLVMGRKTYQTAASAEKWPYAGKRVIVLSSTLTSISNYAELYTGNIVDLVARIYSEGGKHIYVDGGIAIRQFINAGFVDELTLSIIPVLLGSGISLFDQTLPESWYRLSDFKAYANGLMQLYYLLDQRE